MNNISLLKSVIVKNDETQKNLAEAMGISLPTLNAKINHAKGAEFRQKEIGFIKKRYGLLDVEIDAIFLAQRYHKKIQTTLSKRNG